MAAKIRIGHASTDSASTAAAEVLISDYYESLNPTVVLRPKTVELAEKSAAACEAGCNNNKIEYSQKNRNTLYTEAKKHNFNLADITTTCYADCSSFMTVCAMAGGATIKGSSMPNCGSMRKLFVEGGDYLALTSADYLNSSNYLRRGDILVRENYVNGSRHTVMVLDNGSNVPITVAQSADIPIINVIIDIININDTKIELTAKLLKLENKIESNITNLNKYSWVYSITQLDIKSKKSRQRTFSAQGAAAKLVITDLQPDCTYSVSVSATETGGRLVSAHRI